MRGLPVHALILREKTRFSQAASPDHRRWRRPYIAASFTLVVLLALGYLRHYHFRPGTRSSAVATTIDLPEEVQRAWAAYSPYYPAADYTAPPEHCNIVQVNLLQRHGTRFPTKGSSKRIKKSLQKLLSARTYFGEEYQFLRKFEWDLGVNDLLYVGAKEAFDAGSQHYLRYQHLITPDQLPFVRASDSERVVLSAVNWTQGFSVASGNVHSPSVSVIISEESGANNTLDDSMCLNTKSFKAPAKTWRDIFAKPIVKRINEAVPAAHLDSGDVTELMPLCAFETLFHRTASAFCNLFTVEEWQAREYYDDLSKYYKTGYGNALGPVQGVGYVNELLARLTGQPVQDKTQTNHTLDDSPATFPLDRRFYVDFSHDNQMVAIYSAVGLFRGGVGTDEEPPRTDRFDPARRWRVSRMTPFSGRMITEKLRCGDGEEYVRVLVNDALQPLAFCGAGADGLCRLSAFVESQAYARSNGNGDWEKCFS